MHGHCRWISVALAGLTAGGASAQPVLWDGEGGDGLWITDANWNPDGVPPEGADVLSMADVVITAQEMPGIISLKLNSITSTGPGLSLVSGNLEINAASEINGFTTSGCCATDIRANAILTLKGMTTFNTRPVIQGGGQVRIEDQCLFADGLSLNVGSMNIAGDATLGPGTTSDLGIGQFVQVFGTLRMAPGSTTSTLSDPKSEISGIWQVFGMLEHDGTGVPNAECLSEGDLAMVSGSTIRIRSGTLRTTGPLLLQSTVELIDGGVLQIEDVGPAFRQALGTTLNGVGDVEIRAGGFLFGANVVSNLSSPSGPGLLLASSNIVFNGAVTSNGKLTLATSTLTNLSDDLPPESLVIAGGEAETTGSITSEIEVFLTGGDLTVRNDLNHSELFFIGSGSTLDLRPGAMIRSSDDEGTLRLSGGSVSLAPGLSPTDRIDIRSRIEFMSGLMLVEGGELRIRGGMEWTGGEINLGTTDGGSVQLWGCCTDTVTLGDAAATGQGVFRMGGIFSTDRPDIELTGTLTCSVADDENTGLGAILNTRVHGSGTILNTASLELQSSARVEASLINNGELSTSGTARVPGAAVNNALWLQNNPLIVQGGAIINTGIWRVSNSGANITDLSGSFTNTGTYSVEGPGPGRIGHSIGVQLDNIGALNAQNADVFVIFAVQLDENGALTGGTWNAGPNSSIRFPGSVTALTGPETNLRGNGGSMPEAEDIRGINDGATLETTGDTDLSGGGPVRVEDATLRAGAGTTTTDGVESTGDSSVRVGEGARLESSGPVRVGEPPSGDPPSVLADLQSFIAPALTARGGLSTPATVAAPLVELHGRLIPGGEGTIAPLRLEAPVVAFQSATWVFDLDSPLAHDTAHATGQITLDGTLELTLSAEPAPGDSFTIITSDTGIVGTFDTIEALGFPGLRFGVVQGPGSVTVFAACPPDLAEPIGTLNFNDVIGFLTAFSQGDPVADFADPMGVLNFNDVIAYLSAFAAGCP